MRRFDAALLITSFQDHYHELVRFLTRRTGSADQAADLAQDLYVKLAGMGSPSAVIDDPQAYLFRAAGNLAVDRMRQEARHSARHADTDAGETVADPVPSPEATLLSRERLRLFDQALGELPPNVRTALLLFRVEGCPHAEIARRLGVSESMVAKYLARALSHCRDRLRQADRA